MSSKESVLGTLMEKVSSAVEKLYSIERGLRWRNDNPTRTLDIAESELKVLRNEWWFALREARRATTTEQPTSTPTKSNSTSNATLGLIEGHAAASAQNTSMIASRLREILEVLQTGTPGCSTCERSTPDNELNDDIEDDEWNY